MQQWGINQCDISDYCRSKWCTFWVHRGYSNGNKLSKHVYMFHFLKIIMLMMLIDENTNNESPYATRENT